MIKKILQKIENIYLIILWILLVPFLLIITSIIFPLSIIGVTKAAVPLWNVTSGCLSRLITSEEPYPVPLLVKSTELISPLKRG